ncbi:MAG TPA: hypothetical protein VM367_11875 [Pseudonocardia sp.]|jgi:hypothetical protein|nr:hypothetical protein [Pseudonocardia sp.]
MQAPVSLGPQLVERPGNDRPLPARLLDYLPRGNTLDDAAWRRRHRLLEWVLLLHLPLLVLIGLFLRNPVAVIGYSLVAPTLSLALGRFVPRRRLAAFFITGGLVFCSVALVVLTRGSIESHFHFFIIIGFRPRRRTRGCGRSCTASACSPPASAW